MRGSDATILFLLVASPLGAFAQGGEELRGLHRVDTLRISISSLVEIPVSRPNPKVAASSLEILDHPDRIEAAPLGRKLGKRSTTDPEVGDHGIVLGSLLLRPWVAVDLEVGNQLARLLSCLEGYQAKSVREPCLVSPDVAYRAHKGNQSLVVIVDQGCRLISLHGPKESQHFLLGPIAKEFAALERVALSGGTE